MSFDAWKDGQVSPATVEVPVFVPEAVESQELVATLKGYREAVHAIAISPDGRTLATGCIQGGEVKLWDLAARKERVTLKADLGDSYSFAFTPDGEALVVAYYRGETREDPNAIVRGGVILWDVVTGKERSRLRDDVPRAVSWLAVSPDGQTVAAKETWREGKERPIRIALYDVKTAKVRATIPEGHGSGLSFSPDGRRLVASSTLMDGKRWLGRTVRCWDAATGKELAALPSPPPLNAPWNSLAFSPDGDTLAGADYEGNIVLWDMAKSVVKLTLPQEKKRRITCLAFSPDGKTLAAGVGDGPRQNHEPGLIVLFDMPAARQHAVLTGHTSEVYSVAFTPDGKLLVSGGGDRTVRLWDMTRLAAVNGSGQK